MLIVLDILQTSLYIGTWTISSLKIWQLLYFGEAFYFLINKDPHIDN